MFDIRKGWKILNDGENSPPVITSIGITASTGLHSEIFLTGNHNRGAFKVYVRIRVVVFRDTAIPTVQIHGAPSPEVTPPSVKFGG